MPNLPEHVQAGTTPREVTLTRIGSQRFEVTNSRGTRLTIGSGSSGADEFTPVELLLAAIAGCSGIDVDILTSCRALPEPITIVSSGEKVRDDGGHHLTDLQITFSACFPGGEAGDAAPEQLPVAVRRSRDRLCIVSRTVKLGTPVEARIAD